MGAEGSEPAGATCLFPGGVGGLAARSRCLYEPSLARLRRQVWAALACLTPLRDSALPADTTVSAGKALNTSPGRGCHGLMFESYPGMYGPAETPPMAAAVHS